MTQVGGTHSGSEQKGSEQKRPDEAFPHESMLQFFTWAHLRPELQAISRPFGELAATMVECLPRNPERTAALRKLLEAKDCAVRAFLYKEKT